MEFYRYEIRNYSEEFNPSIEIVTLYLHKETPEGYWIGYEKPNSSLKSYKKWISKTSKKRFAYPTKEQAKENFIRRTERRIKILNYQLKISKYVLKLIENEII